jgi:hypothetical protein
VAGRTRRGGTATATDWVSIRNWGYSQKAQGNSDHTGYLLHDVLLSTAERQLAECADQQRFGELVEHFETRLRPTPLEVTLAGWAYLNLHRYSVAVRLLKQAIRDGLAAHGLLAAALECFAGPNRSKHLEYKIRCVLDQGRAAIAYAPAFAQAFYWREVAANGIRTNPDTARENLLKARDAAMQDRLGQKLMPTIAIMLSASYSVVGLSCHALAFAMEGLRHDPSPARRAVLLYRQLVAQVDVGGLARGFEVYLQLEALRDDPDLYIRAVSAYARGVYLHAVDKGDPAREFEIALTCPDPEFRLYARLQLASLLAETNQEEAQKCLDFATELCRGYSIREQAALELSTTVLALAQDRADAATHAARAYRIAQQSNDRRGMMLAKVLEAEAHLVCRHWPKAERALDQARTLGQSLGYPGLGGMLYRLWRIVEAFDQVDAYVCTSWEWTYERLAEHTSEVVQAQELHAMTTEATRQLHAALSQQKYARVLSIFEQIEQRTVDQYALAGIAALRIRPQQTEHALALRRQANGSAYAQLLDVEVAHVVNATQPLGLQDFQLHFVSVSAATNHDGMLINAQLGPDGIPIQIAVNALGASLMFKSAHIRNEELVVDCLDVFDVARKFTLRGISAKEFLTLVNTIVN